MPCPNEHEPRGLWKHGQINAEGTLTQTNGDVSKARMVTGGARARARTYLPNATTVCGPFANDQPRAGHLTGMDGYLYEGSWVCRADRRPGPRHLSGRLGPMWARFPRRAGQWRGPESTIRTSSTYEGNWVDGVIEGEGQATYPNGLVYEGEFRQRAQPWPGGVMTYPDGYRYEGEWQDGQRHGQGTATYPDGTIYVGQFTDGQRDGTGRIEMPGRVHLRG